MEPLLTRELVVGRSLRTTITLKKKDPTTGIWSLADPDTLVFRVKSPDGTTTSKTYGDDAELVKVSTGIYYCSFTGTVDGSWFYRWEWAGNDMDDVRERRVQFTPSAF